MKALYGFKQVLKVWYERLSSFLIKKGFQRGKMDTTLFIKFENNDWLLIQIYIENIICGSTNDKLCQYFSKLM